MPPCHGGGQGFKSPSGRHFAFVAQLVEQGTENPRVSGSIPLEGTTLEIKDLVYECTGVFLCIITRYGRDDYGSIVGFVSDHFPC